MIKILLFCALQISVTLSSLVIDKWEQNGLNYEEYCPRMKFCPEGTHVMCMYYDANQTNAGGPKCNGFKNMSMSYKVAERLLDLMNEIRGRLAMGIETGMNGQQLPRAYGLFKLKWDNEIATFAQVLANTCMFKKDNCRATSKFEDPGQLVSAVRFTVPDWYPVDHPQRFHTPGLTEEKLEYAAKEAVKAWYTMKQLVTPEVIVKAPNSYGQTEQQSKLTAQQMRYLQLVQGDMTHMGCGLSAYEEYVYNTSPVCNTIHIVCNFSTRPKKSTTAYRTGNPYENPLQGHFSKCGCPEGAEEDELCLCSASQVVRKGSGTPTAEDCDSENCKPAVVLLPIFTVDDANGPKDALTRHGYEGLVPNLEEVVRPQPAKSNGPPYNLGYFKDNNHYRRNQLGAGMDPTEDHRTTYVAKSVGAPYTTKRVPLVENQSSGQSLMSSPFSESRVTNLLQSGPTFSRNEPETFNPNQIANQVLNVQPQAQNVQSQAEQFSLGSAASFFSELKQNSNLNNRRVNSPSTSLFGMSQLVPSLPSAPFPDNPRISFHNNQMKTSIISSGMPSDVGTFTNTRRADNVYGQLPSAPKVKESIFAKMPKFSLAKTQSGPKKDVVPRKDFSKAQQMVNFYLTQKAQQNPLFTQTRAPPSLFNTSSDQQTKANDPYDDLIGNPMNTEDITKINEKFDDKLMKLLDTLEQEVKHIELGANEKEYFDARIRKIYGTALGKQPVFTEEPPTPEVTDDNYDLDVIEDPKRTSDKEIFDTEDRVNELSSNEHKYANLPDPQHLKAPFDLLHKLNAKHSESVIKDRYRKPKINHRLDSKSKTIRQKGRTKLKKTYKTFLDTTDLRNPFEAKNKKSYPRKKTRSRYRENRYRQFKDDDDDDVTSLNKIDGFVNPYDSKSNYLSHATDFGGRQHNYYEKEKPRKYKDYDYATAGETDSDVDPLTYERRKYYQKQIDNLKKPLSSRHFDHEMVRARRLMHGHDYEDRIRPIEPDVPPYYRPDRLDRIKFLHRSGF